MLHARNLSVTLRAAIKALSAFSAMLKEEPVAHFVDTGRKNIFHRDLCAYWQFFLRLKKSHQFYDRGKLTSNTGPHWPSLALTI